MAQDKYRCLICDAREFLVSASCWQCATCGREYRCVSGVPCLYLEERLDRHDRKVRDRLYDGLLGRRYQKFMPFLQLPVRPDYAPGWAAYGLVCAAFLALLGQAVHLWPRLAQGIGAQSVLDLVAVLLLAAAGVFLVRHRYFFYLMILAIPVKLSLRSKQFRPPATFGEIHARLLAELQQRAGRLQILDVATGTCNSLYRHGWMKLDAEYTGLDLSETMLLQGKAFMAAQGIEMDFVLGDATDLPFQAESFDVVLNYGALNGCGNAARVLTEMARVAKPGGLVLVLDEQLYEAASAVERLYFRRVLSSHNLYHRWPAELVPPELAQIRAHQVYPFYYLAAGYKQSAGAGRGAHGPSAG
jgi:ubiquinone/menaquinone biosynthesis C-methylase UbiE